MKRIFFFLISIVFSQWIISQDSPMVYKVTNYSINGDNYDQLALENDIALVFYGCSEDSFCFANYWRNSDSQSYGGVYSMTAKEYPETNDNYGSRVFRFTWKFANSYDSDEGEAAVTFTLIYIRNTIKFVAEIIVLNTNEILELKGYAE